jgi:hypothetical protein
MVRGPQILGISMLTEKGLIVSSISIFIRCAFRVAELSGGFNGPIFLDDQIEFIVLEPTMIAIDCIYLTVFHPGTGFKGRWAEANFSFRPWWIKKDSPEQKGSSG